MYLYMQIPQCSSYILFKNDCFLITQYVSIILSTSSFSLELLLISNLHVLVIFSTHLFVPELIFLHFHDYTILFFSSLQVFSNFYI